MPQNAVNSPLRTPSLLIVGCGYLGLRVAKLARTAGWSVATTTRNQSRWESFSKQGFYPLKFDWNDSRDLATLSGTLESREIDRILIAVSYDRHSTIDRYVSQVDGLARLLQTVGGTAQRTSKRIPDVCYISTTGVYHQTGGIWVDENSATRPTRDGGRAHLFAEAKLRSCLGESPWTILRLSGIYGPGRVPRAADVQAGRPIASPVDGHLNLIHVDDAATGVIAAFESGTSRQRLYIASDDRPVVRRHFYDEIAKQTRSPAPVFVDPASDSSARFRSETDKRIWNHRFKRDLVPRLQYPSYVEGLRAIL
jgi:nucleoside-diphosphate-sugar epimerase